MGRVVKFNVVNDAGQGASGQKLLVNEAELTTGANGLAQALIDDGDVKIHLNGVEVFQGPSASLKPMEVISTSGARRA
jgi:hypothetical protein